MHQLKRAAADVDLTVAAQVTDLQCLCPDVAGCDVDSTVGTAKRTDMHVIVGPQVSAIDIDKTVG